MSRPVPHNKMQIRERRDNILILLAKGLKGYEIAKELGVDASTVSRDIQYLITQSHNYLNSLAKEALPIPELPPCYDCDFFICHACRIIDVRILSFPYNFPVPTAPVHCLIIPPVL
ncbi:MAG TPA: helix-turn-helix domain-containing protein [Nitrososphaeraceae archaeon]|nr:helix-turn-helix domain-containing protein [Nitrososphaeraceae archaeon]